MAANMKAKMLTTHIMARFCAIVIWKCLCATV